MIGENASLCDVNRGHAPNQYCGPQFRIGIAKVLLVRETHNSRDPWMYMSDAEKKSPLSVDCVL